ncbi:MAG TPA: DHA2 family efflux MFS transporter permease subunit [Candidatus Baltobacteraceae bacterium]|nr:DHA2 family efflux MFS transporter permease subunit [Candidatus Baltobacteraceae bacterium]
MYQSTIEYGWRRTVVTLAVIAATMLEIVDTTIVNVALPNVQGNLGVSVNDAAWVVTAYIIANVVIIPITPWLQARFGRRAYYLTSIGIFTFASAMCGLSGSFSQLVFWRVVQGVGGGGLISTSQAILRETYPLSEQGKAQGIFSMGVIVGPALGPVLGGFITDNLSWQWTFFINLPIGILTALAVFFVLRNPAPPQKDRKLDWLGLGLLALGLGSLQYVLEQGQTNDWFSDGAIRAFSLFAVVGLVGFVVRTLRTRNPIVDLHVLKYREVAAGSLLGAVLGISLYGSVLILPQYVQNTLNFTATQSGETMLVRALAIMLVTPFAAIIASRGRVDARWMVFGGFILLGISNWMLATVTTPQTEFWTFGASLIVSGLGLSQIFVPLSIAVLGSVPARDVPAASAFFNLARQVGGSIATAVLVTVLVRGVTIHQTALGSDVTLQAQAVQQFLQANGGEHARSALQNLAAFVTQQAYVLSYADTARWTAAISLLLAPLVIVMRRPRPHAS